MSIGSATKALKANIFTAYTAILAQPIQVVYGPEGTYQADDIVEVLDVSVTEGNGPMSPLRKRDYLFTVTGVISCYRGGGTEVQQIATERCFDLLEIITAYHLDSGVQNSTQNNLSGAVLWARVSSFNLHEEDEDIALGRTTACEFMVTGKIRA